MAFVPNFTYDVFVSYAHVDDRPDPGFEDGWVTTLMNCLRVRLDRLCGRKGLFNLWMDHDLERYVEFSPTIMDSLRESAVLMVILSPGYLTSDWCQRERDSFFKEVRRKRADGPCRAFVVERDRVDRARWPAEISGLEGFRFWHAPDERTLRILGDPHPTGPADPYFGQVDDLARALHRELVRLKQEPAVSAAATCDDEKRAFVFLAEVTDDLDPQRDQIKRYLDQHGIGVLPNVWYPREVEPFQEATEQDLSCCAAFVQLLGPLRGKCFPGSSASYVTLQHQGAVNAGKPILQWRDPQLDLNSIEDDHHRGLLQGETVMAVDLETFKAEIVNCTRKAEPRQSRPADQPFVFINIDRDDGPLVENLYEILERHGCGYAIPMYEGRADEIREEMEKHLLDCDGLMIVYGQIPPAWVRAQLLQWRKMLYRREKPLRALAVYEGPPVPKHPLGMKLPDMQIIDCRDGMDMHRLEAFLQSLTAQPTAVRH